MLFGKRRWAFRIIEIAGYEVLSPLGATLVRLLVGRAKTAQRASRRPGDLLHVATAAITLPDDRPALEALASVGGFRPQLAEQLAKAAREIMRRDAALTR
jgi:hypothetical protein